MVELVDALDSKSGSCEGVGVRFPLPAYNKGMQATPVSPYYLPEYAGIERR